MGPSAWGGRDLAGHGLGQRKMAVLQQGIDADRFSPEQRSGDWRRRLSGKMGEDAKVAADGSVDGSVEGNDSGNKKILLFVGRMSAEKDLSFLAECYRELASRRDDVHLAMVGDGPMRAELEEQLGEIATFTGWLQGEELAAAFASADIFVFPSSVDTSGQVILEAQSSGLPAVVCSEGGASENIEPGNTGLTARSRRAAAFNEPIRPLLDDEGPRRPMPPPARRPASGPPRAQRASPVGPAPT